MKKKKIMLAGKPESIQLTADILSSLPQLKGRITVYRAETSAASILMAGSTKFDLYILGQNLPTEGVVMKGSELAKLIYGIDPEVRIIIFTAVPEFVRNFNGTVVDKTKPDFIAKLIEAVLKTLT